jgi:hypothetical protein
MHGSPAAQPLKLSSMINKAQHPFENYRVYYSRRAFWITDRKLLLAGREKEKDVFIPLLILPLYPIESCWVFLF